MFFFKKIKASALQMVLVVSVIIVILLFAFISLIYLQKRINNKNSNYKESIYTNQQAFQYLKTTEIPFGITDSISTLTTSSSNTFVTKKQWGMFELAIVKTTVNRETFQQTALLGTSNSKREALYLKNNHRSLIVVGNTLIKGNVTIPSRGVNSGNIAGVSYNKEKFIYGKIGQSESQIPKVLNKKNITDFLQLYVNDSITFFVPEVGVLKRNSFTQKTLVHQRNGVLNLIDTKLIGNIIIESDTLIRVHGSSILEDVILIAPTIEIQSGFKGSLQAFATKNILVRENSQLAYPSTLLLFNSDKINNINRQIHISKSTTVKGVVGYFSDNESANYKSQILLDNQSKIYGEVYCLGNLELRGEVNGSVYTNSFIASQFGGVYVNHIYNGTINSESLPQQFAGLSITNSSKSIAKWVD